MKVIFKNFKNKLIPLLSLTMIFSLSGCIDDNNDSFLSEKESGQKNELTQQEIDYFNKELDGKYTIIEQLGITGAATSAYLMKDNKGGKFTLKLPNNKSDIDRWIDDNTSVINKFNQIFSDYQGEANIPQYIKIGKDYCIEKYLGKDLTPELYSSLSDQEKDKIARDIASFLVYLHKQDPKDIYENNSDKDFLNNIDKILEHLKNCQTPEEKARLSQEIEAFKNRNKDDEMWVLTHRDIRAQNILYDEECKKVAIIDFELLAKDNIYRDFIPFAAASFDLDYNLLFNIIDYYNQASNYKVDKEKIRSLHELGIWDEYVRCSIADGNKYLPQDVYQQAQNLISQLNHAYESNINNT